MISRLLEKLFFNFSKESLKEYLVSIGYDGGGALDVGCGYGFYSELFKGDYTGIDIDERALARAGKTYPAGKFQKMSAAKLEFADKSFALVFSVLVFHHLNDADAERAIKEMVRVTKDGGHILIVDMVEPPRYKFLSRPVFYLDPGAKRRTSDELAELLSKSGLSPRYKSLKRVLNVGIAVLDYIKK